MSLEAHKCNVKGCKGFIVFENADFDISNPPTVNGMYEFDNPSCTECGKEYKVVPHYVVIGIDGNGDIEQVKSACITQWERREKERKFEDETDPYEKIKKFIQLREYTYDPEMILAGYSKYENGYYVSSSMRDCIENLENEIQSLKSL
ncbi:hypothetical protein [Heyndrickxia oleronia]|uniref:Uncharacterized protein n=1 Tax=Heyndrickxia oleronia TaxID=38875 RepID=A0AAW6SQ67_9BACI|nr:hypothetical protein [Heyndrickxia oleronia]MDH5160368.1 hypothetical protein [Heyndrickxia oleronia]